MPVPGSEIAITCQSDVNIYSIIDPPSPLILAGKVDRGGVRAVREQGLRGGGRGVARAPGVADGRPGQAPDGLPRAGDDGGHLSVGQPRHTGVRSAIHRRMLLPA